MSSKPGVRDLFSADSDDEDHLNKRPRSGNEPNTVCSAAINEKVKEVADKLADFVARNGRKYEDMTRVKNPGNTPFRFLWDKSSKEYKYYENRLHTLLASAGGGSNPGAAAAEGGATLSAMELYMRRLDAAAAQKRQEEIEEEEERRRRAAQPLLKETAFDRRKVRTISSYSSDCGLAAAGCILFIIGKWAAVMAVY
eukprot:gene10194-10355_t